MLHPATSLLEPWLMALRVSWASGVYAACPRPQPDGSEEQGLRPVELRSLLAGVTTLGAVALATVLVAGLSDGGPRVLVLTTFALAPAVLVEWRIMTGLRASMRWLNGDAHIPIPWRDVA